MTAEFGDSDHSNDFRKRPLEDVSEENAAQRPRTSPTPTSPILEEQKSIFNMKPSDARSFQELASFAKGDTQPLGKSQNNLLAMELDKFDSVDDSYEDILVTDPISSPNGFQFNGFGQRVNFPITPGLSRQSIGNGNVSSHGKSSTIKTPGSAIRRMFGGVEGMTDGISLTQAFQQTPTQPNLGNAHGPKSDPIFERPSPNWVSIESPADYVKKPNDDVFRPPQKPASASRQHDPIFDSDDVFQADGDALPTPTQPEPQTVQHYHIKPRVFVGDSEDPYSEISIAHKSPFIPKDGLSPLPLQTPESKSAHFKGFGQFSKMGINHGESLLRKEVIIAATPNSDRSTDSQPQSQPLPRADLPSSPPMIPQSQPSLEMMNHGKNLDNEVQAALDTSIPLPPRSSDLVNSSVADGESKVIDAGKSENPREPEQNEELVMEYGAENDTLPSEEMSTNDQHNHGQANIVPFHKLGEIAAEPSQSTNGSLRMDLLEQDDEYEKAMEPTIFNLSGSSPVDPKRRRNKPSILQPSPKRSQRSQEPSQENYLTNNDDSQSVISQLDLLQFIPDPIKAVEQQAVQTNQVPKPLKFLQDEKTRNSRRQKTLQKNENAGKSIWEFEETQFVTQSEHSNDGGAECTQDNQNAEEHGETVVNTLSLEIRHPNRVLAYCKNPYNACYPATFLNASHFAHGKYACNIVFDDGTTITVPPGQAEKWIFRLEFQVGDVVKVEGKKNKLFIIVGFASLHEEPRPAHGEVTKEHTNLVDIFGHQKVILEPKSRDSSGSTKTLDGSNKVIEPISNIFVGPKEFKAFESRIFIPPRDSPTSLDNSTPKIPNSGRIIQGSRLSTMPLEHLKPLTPALELKDTNSTLFTNMAFAVSIEEEERRRKVVNLIESNGGRIFESGFEELFDLSNTILAENNKTSFKSTIKMMEYSTVLPIYSTYLDLGFTAVIADSYSRKEKHMQALALGLPVLHLRWVEDCISHSTVLSWAKYLLPAGQSSYLGGAVKSRTLDFYDPNSSLAQLNTIFDRRALLLQNKKIVVVPSRAQALSKRQRAFLFLMMSLGVTSLMQVADVATARRILEEQGWDYIYHDVEAKSKKLSSSETTSDLITDEFVAQSLILGELIS